MKPDIDKEYVTVTAENGVFYDFHFGNGNILSASVCEEDDSVMIFLRNGAAFVIELIDKHTVNLKVQRTK